jgi:hypothetical protein
MNQLLSKIDDHIINFGGYRPMGTIDRGQLLGGKRAVRDPYCSGLENAVCPLPQD